MPTFSELVEVLKSWFLYLDTSGDYIFYGIVIAFVFGAVWLLSHWPPLFKKPWLWAVLVGSAFLTLLVYVFIEIPLRSGVQTIMENIWDVYTLSDWLLLSSIPFVLVIGLVQEGAKMVPMVFWWVKGNRNISPKMGLAVGALAGAGFGIFQAVWVNNNILPYLGLPWDAAQNGFEGIALYWQTFFTVGFHIAVSALAGYGLAKGKGYQFYLLAALLHAVIAYVTILEIQFNLTILQVEMYIAVIAVLVTAGALMLRWRKTDDEPAAPVELVEEVEPAEPVEPVETDV
jgi:RsiW-degrading membrane proteinase PrsW (M82 family)